MDAGERFFELSLTLSVTGIGNRVELLSDGIFYF
jgi:hypothetical protein